MRSIYLKEKLMTCPYAILFLANVYYERPQKGRLRQFFKLNWKHWKSRSFGRRWGIACGASLLKAGFKRLCFEYQFLDEESGPSIEKVSWIFFKNLDKLSPLSQSRLSMNFKNTWFKRATRPRSNLQSSFILLWLK